MKQYRLMIEETHSFSIIVDAMDESHAEDIGYDLTLDKNYPQLVMSYPSYEEAGDHVDVAVWLLDEETSDE
jgi:hypothetical protein